MGETQSRLVGRRVALVVGITVMGAAAWGCGGDDAAGDRAGTTTESTDAGSETSETTDGSAPAIPSPEELAAAVDGPSDVSTVQDPDARISQVEASFLSEWMLLRVEPSSPHAHMLYLAYGDGRAWSVDDPYDFDRMVAEDGTGVADATIAEDLARTRVEVTGRILGIHRVVESVDDVEFRPNLEDDDAGRRDEIVDELGDVIAPPEVEAHANGGWTVTLYSVAYCAPGPSGEGGEADIARWEITVSPDGAVDDSTDPLVTDAPVAYCA